MEMLTTYEDKRVDITWLDNVVELGGPMYLVGLFEDKPSMILFLNDVKLNIIMTAWGH